jgi:hypothetical protein
MFLKYRLGRLVALVYIRTTLRYRSGAKRRAGGWSSDPMIEADAPSTGEVIACFRRCTRPTGDRYVRTNDDPAQRFEGAMRRPRQSRRPSAAKSIIRAGAP